MTFCIILLRSQFFCLPFILSQHEMTIFLVPGPRKKCAGPKSKMAAVLPENHILCHKLIIWRCFHMVLVSFPMFRGSGNLFVHTRRATDDWMMIYCHFGPNLGHFPSQNQHISVQGWAINGCFKTKLDMSHLKQLPVLINMIPF